MSKVLFFEKTPFMSVELLDIASNYEIVSYDDSSVYQLLSQLGYALRTYGNQDLTKKLGNDIAMELLLADQTFIEALKKDGDVRALFFYMNAAMNKLLDQAELKTVLPSFNLQDKLGSKLLIPTICDVLSLPTNPTLLFKDETRDAVEIFDQCATTLGMPFIIQGARGVSGEDTFLIRSEQEFLENYSLLTSEFKAARYLQDVIPISIHVCVGTDLTSTEGPFLQVMGFPELATNPYQFAGNDTNQSLFTSELKSKISDMTSAIAQYADNFGYKGIFGIDYLWDVKSGDVYLQELNTRLVGLTRLLTGVQKEQAVFPDLIAHLETFLGEGSMGDFSKYEKKAISLESTHYSQVYISNNTSNEVVISNYVKPGIYTLELDNLVRKSDSLFVKDMASDDILLTHAPYQGSHIGSDGVIARIILKKSIIEQGKYQLTPEALTLVQRIRNYLTRK